MKLKEENEELQLAQVAGTLSLYFFYNKLSGLLIFLPHLMSSVIYMCLTLKLPRVTKTEFLLAISIQYQAGK